MYSVSGVYVPTIPSARALMLLVVTCVLCMGTRNRVMEGATRSPVFLSEINFSEFHHRHYCRSLPTTKHMASKACTHLRRAGRHVQQLDTQIRCFSNCTARCITRSTIQTRNIASTSRPTLRPNPTGICSARRRGYHYYTEVEQDHDRIIQTSIGKVEEFEKASKAVRCPLFRDYQN